MKRFFITGTDTDCGKTYVTCQLLDFLNKNYKAQALKPVASGGIADIQALHAYNADPELPINRWCFSPPIAPHIAAARDNQQLGAEDIYTFCASPAFQHFDYLVVEGAGGLMVPLNKQETWLDFLKLSQLSVIIVVGVQLGCINHALLTDLVLTHTPQVPYAGWVANCLHPPTSEDEEIIGTLMLKMHSPLITTVFQYGKINFLDKSFF